MKKKLKMWVEGDTINIEVLKYYIYDCHNIRKIGSAADNPGSTSAYAWLNHISQKNWWNIEQNGEFLQLVVKIIKSHG